MPLLCRVDLANGPDHTSDYRPLVMADGYESIDVLVFEGRDVVPLTLPRSRKPGNGQRMHGAVSPLLNEPKSGNT